MDLITCTCYIVLNMASQHIDPAGMNQYNPGVGIEVNGYAIGEYRNSLERTSVYAAKLFRTQGTVRYGVAVGAVTGYPSIIGKSRIDPLIAPMVSFEKGRFGANLALVPSPVRINQSAVALQLKFKL